MFDRIVDKARPQAAPVVFAAGIFMLAVSVAGFVLGLMVIGSLTDDFRASMRVSRSAITSIGDTISVVEQVAEGTSASLETAARSASSAAATTRGAATGIDSVADFLDRQLSHDIEAVLSALPGAVQAADAVDTALGALSLLGVDYAPDEPFGESLRGIQTALTPLPDELRRQSETLRLLAPSAETLADDTQDLAASLEELGESLGEIDRLTDSYSATVTDAEALFSRTSSSLDRTVLLLRITLLLVSLSAAVVGSALISIDRALGRLVAPFEGTES